MKRVFHYILVGLLLPMMVGCNTTNSNQQEILAGGSQVELRSYQTRTYDTDDKIRVLRAVVSTLQDLGFVLDKADDVIGIVSATKLDRASNYQVYKLSMSISVRPSGQQMTVRANAQFNLTAIEDPGPYQDFFTSLDKGLFLDDNLLTDNVQVQNSAKVTSTASVAGLGERSFEYYGQAEKEISSGTYDPNLWARALVEAEGDEQKRKAKYIQLRADELYYQNAASKPKSSSNQPICPVINSQPGAGESVVAVKQLNPEKDISGSYVSDIDPASDGFLENNRDMVLTISQYGNQITATDKSNRVKITGTREGDTIKYLWINRIGGYPDIDGEWKINADGSGLDGRWESFHRGGQWNLKKLQ